MALSSKDYEILSEPRHIERFEALIAFEPMSGCWLWAGSNRHRNGYGSFGAGWSNFHSHRASFYIYTGQSPVGFLVCHKCDNPYCVNPDHLFLGTQRDNMGDASRKKRLDNRNCARGNEQPAAKLSNEIVKVIRQSTLSTYVLAKKFGVAQGTIDRARSGKTWSHIEGGIPRRKVVRHYSEDDRKIAGDATIRPDVAAKLLGRSVSAIKTFRFDLLRRNPKGRGAGGPRQSASPKRGAPA